MSFTGKALTGVFILLIETLMPAVRPLVFRVVSAYGIAMQISELIPVLLREPPGPVVSTLNPAESLLPGDDPVAVWRRSHHDRHPHREAMLFLGGGGTQSLEGHVYRCRPGTLFLFDSHERHDQGYPPEYAGSAHLWMFVLEDSVNCVLDEMGEGGYAVLRRFLFRSPELVARLHRGWDEARAGFPPAVALGRLTAFFTLVLAEFAAELVRREEEVETESASHQKEVIQSILARLDRTCGKGADIPSLARQAGYSTSHFLRLFQRHAGCRVREYIDARRQLRYEALRREGLPVKVIAEELGFSSSAALAHWRKR